MARNVTTADGSRRARSLVLLVCTALSIGLCAWGTLGWRRAYRAQAEVDHLRWAERLEDAQLLRIVVAGGEAVARLALEGPPETAASAQLEDAPAPAPGASWVYSVVDGE